MAKAFPQAPKPAPVSLADPPRRAVTLSVVVLLLLALAAPHALAQSKSKKKLTHLTIVDAQFLDGQDGYPLPPNSAFYPGEQVYLLFRIGGFHVTESEYRMKLSYGIDFLGVGDAPFATREAGAVAEEVYPQDEKWMPVVRAAPRLPFHADAGFYKIQLYAKDELNGEEARDELTFQVLGKQLGDASKLTVRNFAFTRGEEGAVIEKPSYRPGETLWGSFFITGFALGQENAFDVDSNLQIVDDEGEVMRSFTPEDEEQGETFYPRRWLPGRFRVDLDKDIPKGQYAILLSVRDAIGKQESETRYPFEIR